MLKGIRYSFIITGIILLIYGFCCAVLSNGNKLLEMLPTLALIMALALLLSCITDGILLPFVEYLEKKHKKGGLENGSKNKNRNSCFIK